LRASSSPVSLGLIAALLLSPRLWLSGRTFPLTPVIAFLHPVPAPFDALIYGAMLVLAALIVVLPRARFIAAFLALAVAYALFDQQRWQPWFYQYLAMLAAVGWYSDKREAALQTLRLMIVCIYFWSGVQKLNDGFLHDTFRWMLEPLAGSRAASLEWLAWLAPVIESGIALGLLLPRTRRIAVCLAIVMHAFILASIGPFGHRHNSVVWPWNIVMAVLVVQLFWRGEGPGIRLPFQKAVLVLFGILPALSLVGLWDSYLSFSLYSGNQSMATIYMSDAVAGELPDRIQEAIDDNDSKLEELDVESWSYDELNVPPYAELRVFRNVARKVCADAGNPRDMVMIVEEKRTLFHRRSMRYFTCDMVER
jgi:uncharacterized membrane protein YphA (DoxX/SURF4 family)